MANGTVFAPQHAWDRNFFLSFILLCVFAVVIGFEPAVSARMQGNADYPASPFLQMHAITFIGWLCLLALQIGLIRTRQVNIHRTLGLIGFGLIPVMVVSGLVSERLSQQFYSPHDADNLRFFIYPIMAMVMFPALALGALALRRNPSAHKRLIALATVSIEAGPFYRWWGQHFEAALGKGFIGVMASFYAGYYLLLALLAAYDLYTRRQLHPVYRKLLPVMVLVPPVVSAIYHSDWWPDVARAVAGI